jgi:DNA damage-binding protein 1
LGLSYRRLARFRFVPQLIISATTVESSTKGGKILISDDSGRLTAFSWTFNNDSGNGRTVNIGKADMGLTSPASSLTPLSSNHLFCASACGDSTLLHLDIPSPGPPSSPTAPSSSPRRRLKGKGKEEVSSPSSIIVSEPSMGSTEVLERWVNLAPVKDFCAVGDQSGGTVSHRIEGGQSILMR